MSGLLSKLFKVSGRRKGERLFCSAIILAAGRGERMRGRNKLFAEIDGEPVLVHTLRAFELCPEVDEIIVVARPEEIGNIGVLISDYGFSKVSKVVRGGEKRQDSVYIGLMEASPKSQLAAIHDAARPLVTQKVISETIKAAAQFNAAAPGVPVKDTVKVVKSGEVKYSRQGNTVRNTDATGFKTDIIKAALTDVLRTKLRLPTTVWQSKSSGLRLK